MLPLVVPSAVINLSFDPIVVVGGMNVRLETLGVAAAIFLGLVAAVLVARGTSLDPSLPPEAPGAEPGEHNHLRADDLLYISVAAVPGAVIAGRLGYALIHLDYYRSNTAALFEVGAGGFQLSLGVVGGILTASIVASLLGVPLRRWMHALALPLLLALSAGKAALVLGGTGQGQASDVSWATAYLGPGPWGSLAPALPAHPSQGYEAMATIVVMMVVMWFLAFDAFPGRNGGVLFLALGLWAVARALVATTWRDPQVLGPLRMDQVISIVIASASFALMAAIGGVAVARGRRASDAADPRPAGPDPAGPDPTGPGPGPATVPAGTQATATGPDRIAWPDPEKRPRI